jgi:hypothetical protein
MKLYMRGETQRETIKPLFKFKSHETYKIKENKLQKSLKN